ncbi:MAG: site-2 protease family protein [Candidatus Pacearchaeota archaeon]
MSFVLYDITFLAIFLLFVIIFLYTKKHNLKREGLLYLYKTKFGLKVIEGAAKKFSRILKPLQYLVIVSGYALMGFMIWLLFRFAYLYITSPYVAKELKIPVVMPLIPYLPDIFKIDFLPPFYFTYWIVIIAIIAIPHEFFHGIFAKLNNVRIKSTGFGFLGPFLAAFVEQDDKQMQKSSKFSQLSILAAGTFANLLTGIFFGAILLLFFASAFAPAGVYFNSYSMDAINISSISSISNVTINNQAFLQISAENKTYFADISMFETIKQNGAPYIIAYEESPAFNARLSGAIFEINGEKITNYQQLNASLSSKSPGDVITIKTINEKSEIKEYEIRLAEKNGKAFLGIMFVDTISSKFLSWLHSLIAKVKEPFVFYQSKIGELGIFINDLLLWIVLISFSVALMNMLPAGMFDGGRFFYLSVLGITGSKKIAEKSFKYVTTLLLVLLAVMLLKWVFAISF